MNRLWVQLTLAFALVVFVVVAAIAILIGRTADIEFRQYVTHSGIRASGSGMQQLVAYYQDHGSWKGVDRLLGQGVVISGPVSTQMMDRDWRPGMPGRSMDVLLADADGKIVFDSAGAAQGKRLSARQRSRALPITESDGGEVLGYLLLALPAPPEGLGSLEQRFLQRLRGILLVGAMLAVGVGLVMGLGLSRGLTAPLQRLAAAARAVAHGDFEQQVRIRGSAEIVEVGQAFNEMTSALAEAETQRQNLVADVAHELRTPLSVVQGNLRAILDDVYPLDKAEITRLYDETRLLSRLVDDLRELALADAGQLRLDVRPIDLAPVIQATADNLILAAEAQQVGLAIRLPTGLPPVHADPDRVAQVLRNLLVNALRHTPPGGSVTLAATPRHDVVEIAVTDTGEGIAPEDLPRVFDRFWRSDPARARANRGHDHGDRAGTGLGLSVAQSLVEAQGGRIWVESSPGQGAVFRFTLARAGPESGAMTGQDSRSTPSL